MTDYSSEYGAAFQKHILAVMCRAPGFVLAARTALDHQFFANDQHRAVAKALLAHVDEFQTLPTHSLLFEDAQGTVDDPESIATLIESLYAEDIGDATAVAGKAVEFGKTQALINAVIEGAERLEKGDRDIRPLIDEALMVGEDLLNLGLRYHDVEDRLGWYTNPETAGGERIRTGIQHLDALLQGGMLRGTLGVVLAPPKRGKSTTLVNIGFGALTDVAGLNVVHYTCELKKRPVTMRYDDRLMGLRVKYKKSDPHRYTTELMQRAEKLLRGTLFIQEYRPRFATVSRLRTHLSLLASRGVSPDVVVVDYADLLKPERRLGESRHEAAGIYEDLRALAGEFDCVVWTASQAKVGALDKEVITMADFAESFEKAAVLDAGFAFCQTPDEEIDGRMRLFAAALRDVPGMFSTVECDIRRDCCWIRSTSLLDPAGTCVLGESAVNDTVAAVKKTVQTDGAVKKAKAAKKKVTKKKAGSTVKKKKKTTPTHEVL